MPHPSRPHLARPWTALGAPLAAAVTALALAVVGGPAMAAPGDGTPPSKQDIASGQQRVSALSGSIAEQRAALQKDRAALQQLMVDAAAKVERYQAAQIRLQQAQESAALARRAASRASRSFASTQDELGRLAAQQYMSGGVVAPALALAFSDTSDVLTQAATMTVLADHQRLLVDHAKATSIVSDVMSQRAKQSLARVRADTAALAKARDAAKRELDQQQSRIDALVARINSLDGALGHAQTTVASLSAARASWLSQQAANDSNGGGSNGGGSNGGGSGGSPTPDPTPTTNPTPTPTPPPSGHGASAAVAYAVAQLGKPYVYGGSGPDVFDCSGLTMRAWEAAGVMLYHSAIYQYAQSTPVSRAQARPGDLVFFADGPKYTDIYHVGLYVGNGTMIEAPYTGEVVRYASVDRDSLFGFARP